MPWLAFACGHGGSRAKAIEALKYELRCKGLFGSLRIVLDTKSNVS
jgi:hypothetical protein